MSIKKILLFSILSIIIPYTLITIFFNQEKVYENTNFDYSNNQVVRIYRQSTDRIEKIPIEEYIIGVIAGEMPVSYEIEALKAQAVAARSYVMKKIEYNKNNDYDVVDSIKNQVYLDDEHLKAVWSDNYYKNIDKIKQAVIETKGEYLTYDEEVIEAFFFSTSSGNTESCVDVFGSDIPYLKSVDSSWDSNTSTYSKTLEISINEFYENLNLPYQESVEFLVLEKTEGGSNKIVKINNETFKSTDVRTKLNLRSTNFTLEQNGDLIIITTKGYGHGVGMSQNGANIMAKNGSTYEEILKHYYTGVEIQKF